MGSTLGINKKLERVYVCMICYEKFLFHSDVTEHISETGHDMVKELLLVG